MNNVYQLRVAVNPAFIVTARYLLAFDEQGPRIVASQASRLLTRVNADIIPFPRRTK